LISKFMNLSTEKQERILNAALKEFAQKGYKNASTNEIVKGAKISKGLLFHYFSNKKSLFMFLLDHAGNIFLDEFYSRLNYDETDIVSRWRQIVLLKIDLIQKHPDLYEFLITSSTDDSLEIKLEVESRSKGILEDGYKRLLENIDTSGYKEGLDIKRVSDIIIWIVQGFGNSELEKMKHIPEYKTHYDLNVIMAEFDEYMELFKNAFYAN
jgi:TetR/AcrR family transcriptional regulator